MTPLSPLLTADHRQAVGAEQFGAARADIIALSFTVLQFVGHKVVVADAAARAIRQAGDGAIALEDPAQVVDERAHFPPNLRSLRQAFALAELARRDRRVRQLGGIVVFLRAGVRATVVWPLGYTLWLSWRRCTPVAGLALLEWRRSLARHGTLRGIPAILSWPPGGPSTLLWRLLGGAGYPLAILTPGAGIGKVTL
jgi:hypothetical protein